MNIIIKLNDKIIISNIFTHGIRYNKERLKYKINKIFIIFSLFIYIRNLLQLLILIKNNEKRFF